MSDRRAFLAGNWKMHLRREEAADLARGLRDRIGDDPGRDVALFPPLTSLDAVREAVRDSSIRVGAQNCHFESEGAYTGEVSAEMLADAGCELVLVGHSERRHVFGEDEETVRRKLEAVLRAGLEGVLCVGETREAREAGRTEEVVRAQLEAGLRGLPPTDTARITLAYEPVWAIGTGLTATPGQAQEVHAFAREILAELFSPQVAAETRIQYGGSVKPGNIASLMREPDVDGALVGGASLDAESFASIVRFEGV